MHRNFLVCVIFMALNSFSANAETIPITPFTPSTTQFPQSMNILGVTTGMNLTEATDILRKRGFRASQKNWMKSKIPCFLNEVCGTFNNSNTYTSYEEFLKDNETIRITFTPPYAGSKAVKIVREIRYRSYAELPVFENTYDATRDKFGKGIFFKKKRMGCWPIKDGSLLLPKRLDRDLCYYDLTKSDGFVGLYYDGNEIRYVMFDRLLSEHSKSAPYEQLKKHFHTKKNNIENNRDQKKAPTL